ncbi:hypothetical protein [Neorhodopirellula pilleata]|uniref:DUF4303 domain-containing protein n=1 Tax=Neorhodopirellula pilleata TaxID=2714738 RepID=A0A5C5ZZX3_9BACT|nr:hypothetical protein [Neorhodopirellula pilleata]TWT92607.1 hypothetical protein Pla100_46270 [Neorhodopirellula pilleata]
MDLPAARGRLATLILDGLGAGERRARSELSPETLYATVLYSASGFRGLVVAVNTREALDRTAGNRTGVDAGLLEMLKDHPDLLAKAVASSTPEPDVCVCDWEYVYSDLPHEDAEKLIDDLYEYFYELDWEPEPISDWFLETVSIAVQEFARSLPQNNGLLLGLQFSDPSVAETRMMEGISEMVNSPFWHAKVMAACNVLRETS